MTLHRSTCIPAPEFSHRETKEPVPPQGTLERLLLRTEQTGWSVVYAGGTLSSIRAEASDGKSYGTEALRDRLIGCRVGDHRTTHPWRQAWWTATRDEHSGGDQCDFLPLEDRLRMASLAA